METASKALRSVTKCLCSFCKMERRWYLGAYFSELNKEADTENLSIDSTCVKVHESSNGGGKKENKAIGLTKGGLHTKIHAIVEWVRDGVSQKVGR